MRGPPPSRHVSAIASPVLVQSIPILPADDDSAPYLAALVVSSWTIMPMRVATSASRSKSGPPLGLLVGGELAFQNVAERDRTPVFGGGQGMGFRQRLDAAFESGRSVSASAASRSGFRERSVGSATIVPVSFMTASKRE
jgi:hypothetical protein